MTVETQQETTVSEDALIASLDQLVKAAGAEGVVSKLKKGGIVYSGFEDERGKQGGGGASASDAGGLEQMMIGKLVAGGMSQEMAAKATSDLMGLINASGLVGKQEDEEEEEGEEDEEGEMSGYARGYMDAQKKFGKSMSGGDEEDEGEDETPAVPAPKALRKSHAQQFSEDNDISEGVDASPFLEALTAKTTASLDGLTKSMQAGHARQGSVNKAIAGALYQMGSLVKSQASVINQLGNRLGMVERAPAAAPKGSTSLKGAQAMAKSIGAGNGEGSESLTKSEAASALSYLRFEKGVETIEGERTGALAVMAESGGTLSKSVHEYVSRYLATHPNERKAATTYR